MAFLAAIPAWVGTAAAVASTVMSVVSSISQGKEANARNKAAADAERYNAAVARNKAENLRAAYDQKEEQQRRQARIIIGQQRASAAQSGVGLGGSVADMEMQSMMNAEMDSLNIRYQGSTESQGLLAQADMNDYNAGNYRAAGKSAVSNSYMAAGAGLLSGAAKLFTPASATTKPSVE